MRAQGSRPAVPAYVEELQELLRLRELEIRALKERLEELAVKVAAGGDAALLAQRWRSIARELMAMVDGGERMTEGRRP